MQYSENSRLSIISVSFGEYHIDNRLSMETEYGIMYTHVDPGKRSYTRYLSTGVLTVPLYGTTKEEILSSEVEDKIISELNNCYNDAQALIVDGILCLSEDVEISSIKFGQHNSDKRTAVEIEYSIAYRDAPFKNQTNGSLILGLESSNDENIHKLLDIVYRIKILATKLILAERESLYFYDDEIDLYEIKDGSGNE